MTQIPKVAVFLEALPINLGNLGVALFFLISGFLMPLVANNKTRLNFIGRRMKRIWPPYVAALLLTILLVYVHSIYNNRDFPLTWDHMIVSLLLCRDIGGYHFIDGIVWTLEIELKFYLLCCLALPWLTDKPLRFMLLIIVLAFFSLMATEWIDGDASQRLLLVFFKNMKYISFMGLGCLLSYLYQGKITKKNAIVLGSMLAIMFIWHAIEGMENYKEMASYALALVVFVSCHTIKHRFTDKGLLAQIGKISYSLYLVHGVFGFMLIYVLWTGGVNVNFLAFAAMFSAMLIAYCFYWGIENHVVKQY